jgi:hypothetical protein
MLVENQRLNQKVDEYKRLFIEKQQDNIEQEQKILDQEMISHD